MGGDGFEPEPLSQKGVQQYTMKALMNNKDPSMETYPFKHLKKIFVNVLHPSKKPFYTFSLIF